MTWQPIKTAPRVGEAILLWAHGYEVQVGAFDKDSQLFESDNVGRGTFHAENRQPTHWMPLPAPPA